MNLKVFTDGGAKGNPGPAAVGVVIKNQKGEVIAEFGRKIGYGTNNIAEYKGVIEALKYLARHATRDTKHVKEKHLDQHDQHVIRYMLHVTRVDFYIDSKLVVNQLNGVFKIKNSKLRELILKIKNLEQEIPAQIFYHFIPREKNLAHQQVDKGFEDD